MPRKRRLEGAEKFLLALFETLRGKIDRRRREREQANEKEPQAHRKQAKRGREACQIRAHERI